MKRCARCNKKRSVFEQWLSLDTEFCDECLFDIDEEIRERQILPVRRLKDDPARNTNRKSSR
ncbi:hypothetical protein CES93_16165 [Citrobacter freundii]|nr:hypothetical protein CES93_16165 [Citrobacter freundii]AUZ68944.1 hypothetical protein C2U41_05905 [Citrobacter freundii complex sp. CFNIH4]EMF21466.1 hypothetical protein H262_17726 [Citrobacter freundii GTC 09479]POU08961.1 hypothetical protein C3368_22545 [Citrobacter freundii complex sp. CFNIH7]POU10313.1 hypothetical protein C3381_22685 [Citrobacter freundii complex sp. CFNIH6]QDE43964.1 hypothetical protein E6P06_12350 [Citrobacter sp. CF971]TKU54293.1 hypothetical protein FDX08_0791